MQPARCLTENGEDMMQDLKDAIGRDFPALAQDFAGAVALVAVLVVALNLPALL